MDSKTTAINTIKKLLAVIALPVAAVYSELLFRSLAGLNGSGSLSVPGLLISLTFGFILSYICVLAGGRTGKILCAVFIELIAVWTCITFFMGDTYRSYMSPDMIFGNAGNAVGEFGDVIINAITSGLGTILLFHIPFILFLILLRFADFGKDARLVNAVVAAGLAIICAVPGYLKCSWPASYDSAVRKTGIIPALEMSIKNLLQTSGTGSSHTFSSASSSAAASAEQSTTDEKEQEKAPEYNMLDLTFPETDNEDILALNSYVSGLTPTEKNEYTGMFEGKNLIFITAESFTREVIDEEHTPTLYRMAQSGIVLDDFYQPFWGGSTTTGEYSLMTGLIPTEQNAMQKTTNNNMYMTIFNSLLRQGYTGHAYHDGTSEYYHRDRTHTNLGFEDFTAIGNGMEKAVEYNKYANSDVDMMKFSVPQYENDEPFEVYYMTISGHGTYSFESNPIDSKNKEAVSDMTQYTKTVRAYMAGNLEFEYSLEYLLEELEKAGTLENTVIVIGSDHYPYPLEESYAWGSSEADIVSLYGYSPETQPQRDHNIAIIWSPCLESEEQIVVSEPTYSIDITPTLLNLFGIEYDSRLLPGRDVLSDSDALVIWEDASWLTAKGYYDTTSESFTPTDGAGAADDEYISMVNSIVSDKMAFSAKALSTDYYGYLFGEKTKD